MPGTEADLIDYLMVRWEEQNYPEGSHLDGAGRRVSRQLPDHDREAVWSIKDRIVEGAVDRCASYKESPRYPVFLLGPYAS